LKVEKTKNEKSNSQEWRKREIRIKGDFYSKGDMEETV